MSTYETQGSIIIAASPAQIMGVLSQVEQYPEWISLIQSVRVVALAPDGRPRLVQFRIKKGLYHDEVEFEIVWDSNERVDWLLIGSIIERSNIGSYTLTPLSDGTTKVEFDDVVGYEFPKSEKRKSEISKQILNDALEGLAVRVPVSSETE